MSNKHPSAATDVGEFVAELDAGQFERKLSVALSRVASAVTDHDKVGEVNIKFKVRKVKGTHQVAISHELKFVQPTTAGRVLEEDKRDTVMYVGKFGRLSLVPESQTDMFKAPAKQD